MAAFSGFERAAQIKLDRLDAATTILDLAALPENRLEALKGDRQGQWSIRGNDQWRICFNWIKEDLGQSDVEIVDYHRGAPLMKPIHPGEHLAEELTELDLSAAEFSRRLGVPTNRITQILKGQRTITGDTALRLGHFFSMDPQFWLNLQSLYELRLTQAKIGASLRQLPTLASFRGSEQTT